jgi:hypothetical protein
MLISLLIQLTILMNKKNIISMFGMFALIVCSITGWARPEYVAPTGASGCTDCHVNNSGSGYKTGVITAYYSSSNRMVGLKNYITALNGQVQAPDTQPVLHPINSKWDVTVGELPLVISFQVTDAENDAFALHGSAPTGVSISSVYTKNNLPTIDLSWTPKATDASKVFPLQVYVTETATGRSLSSNTVQATIQVWPARTTTANVVTQFSMESAQWQNNVLTLNGQVVLKNTLSVAQRKAALNTLKLNVKSNFGKIIVNATKLSVDAKGSWVKKITLTAAQVPCTVKLTYEGLRASRPVSLAPSATCVK